MCPSAAQAGVETAVLAGAGDEAARPAFGLAGGERRRGRARTPAPARRAAAGRAGGARSAGRCAGTAAERRRSAGRARARRRAPRPSATTRFARPSASASSAPTARPVRIRSIARLSPMSRGRRTVPPSISGTPKRRQKTPKVAARRGDAQVAPQGELEAAGDGVALDGGDHRLRQLQPRRAHRPVARHVGVEGERQAVVGSPRSPGAVPRATVRRSAPAQKWPPAPVRIGDAGGGVGVEGAERVGERARRRAVDGVADLGAVDRHGPDMLARASMRTVARHARLRCGLQHQRHGLGGERVEVDAAARLRGFERYQVAEKLIAPRIISRASCGSAASRPCGVQLVERRLPDRVVAVLQLDDAAPVLRRQRAPVVEHHRDEVAAGVVQDAVVRAHQAAEALDRRRGRRSSRRRGCGRGRGAGPLPSPPSAARACWRSDRTGCPTACRRRRRCRGSSCPRSPSRGTAAPRRGPARRGGCRGRRFSGLYADGWRASSLQSNCLLGEAENSRRRPSERNAASQTPKASKETVLRQCRSSSAASRKAASTA